MNLMWLGVERRLDEYTRPSYDEWGLILAKAVATRGDCRRRQIGAVILDADHRIVGAGYNGAPPGEPGCLAGNCPRAFSDVPPDAPYTGRGNCIATHAEMNCLMDAGRDKLSPGCVMYVSDKPCPDCQKMLRGFKVKAKWPGSEQNGDQS